MSGERSIRKGVLEKRNHSRLLWAKTAGDDDRTVRREEGGLDGDDRRAPVGCLPGGVRGQLREGGIVFLNRQTRVGHWGA